MSFKLQGRFEGRLDFDKQMLTNLAVGINFSQVQCTATPASTTFPMSLKWMSMATNWNLVLLNDEQQHISTSEHD